MYKYRITVFTPTYNRAYVLPSLYESLKQQTFNDFEWLIVDDGSVDNTEELVAKWAKEGMGFPIRYIKKENGGKHSAVNVGLDCADGEIFFTMDSDDTLTPDALRKINGWFEEIKDYPDIKGIVANRGDSPATTVNKFFASQFMDAVFFDMKTYRENGELVLDGERAIAFYTDFHREYKYPIFQDENFMTEAVVYNRMAHDGYKMRFYNDIIWIYEYLDDGLTKAGSEIFIKNPQGHGLCLREKAEFLNYSIKNKMKMWYTFYCDHSFCDEKYRLKKKQCARYIGAPVVFIYMSAIARKLNGLIKKIRK